MIFITYISIVIISTFIILFPSVVSFPLCMLCPMISDFIYLPTHVFLINFWKSIGVN